MGRFPHPSSLPKAERERRRKVALLTSARVARFGPLPTDADASVWWQQMQTIAAELGIAITWDEVQAPAPPPQEVETP